MSHSHPESSRAFTLLEIIVGISVMMIVFIALFESFSALAKFGEQNRLHTQAVLLANEHIEMIRALPYEHIGTLAGLPSGTIPQTEDIVHDGRTYTRRTFIQYVDDPADGIDVADTLTADYKRVKVELSYLYRDTVHTFSMITSIAPKSQESLAGAGILRLVVNDADNDPLSSATVHVENMTIATTVDITTFTNASGTISFPGAWAGSGYEITVSKAGYSTAGTYTSSVDNPNPSPSPLTVAENSTTELYLKIDRLSTLTLFTRLPPTRGRLYDDFLDSTQIALHENTSITGGSLVLAGSPGSYAIEGTTTSQAISPATLGHWILVSASTTRPVGTNVLYQVEYDAGGGVFLPIPDTDLPGNATWFTSDFININNLNPTIYTSVRIVARLTSSDLFNTPTIHEWTISYLEPDVPLAGVSVGVRGAKTIGTDSVGSSVYKYDETHTTPANGSVLLSNMEFDEYTITTPGYHVAEACPSLPVNLEPGTAIDQTLTLHTGSTHTFALTIAHPLGGAVTYAEVRLTGPGVDTVGVTGPCGVAYFANLNEGSYTATVRAAGLTETQHTYAVSDQTTAILTMSL